MRQKDLQNAEKFIMKHRLYRRWIIVISVLSIIVSAATFYLLNKPATAVSETTATEVGIADAQPAGEQAQAGAQESVAQDNAGASENNIGNAAGTEAAADNAQAGTETAAQTTETADTTDTTDTAETKTETAKAKSDAAGTVTFTAEYVDENGNKLRDSEPLSVGDSLDLTVSPADIEGYSFVRAQIDGTEARSITRLQASSEVSTSIAVSDDEDAAAADKSEDSAAAVQQTGDDNSSAAAQQSGSGDAANDKTAASSTQSTASGHGAAAYVYTAADGTQKELAGDTTVTMIYTSDAVKLKATLVDEFGTEIDSSRYTKIDLPAPDKDGMIVLDDPADAPYKDVKVNKGLFKTVKYTYVKATVDGTDVKAIRVNSRTAEKTDTAKTEDTASDKAAGYSYTADGTAWKDITADSVVTMVYSSGTKTEYTYEDENVEVTARLQKAGAVPDDAEFRVIQIKAGKAFDAYITALNDADKDKPEDQRIEHTADNTLLYDVSFITKETDSDGKPTGKETEFEPLDGTVQVSFEFKKNQLTDIGAAAPDSLSVSHLVLNDDVKAKADTTLEAAQKADASDIKVDDMKIDSASVDGTQSLDITADSFSTFAVTANNDVNNTYSVGTGDYQNILGDAVEYGIVADTYDSTNSDTETNFAVKNFIRENDLSVDLTNTDATIPFITEKIEKNLRLGTKTSNNNIDVYLQERDKDKVRADGGSSIKINKIFKTEAELDSTVSAMQDHVSSASAMLAKCKETTGWTTSEKEIDTTNIPDNVTIVIDVDGSIKDYSNLDTNHQNIMKGLSDKLSIKKLANQNIVFNVSASDITILKEYSVKVGNNTPVSTNEQDYSGTDSEKNKQIDSMILQHIIWNVTSSNGIQLQQTAGVFLFPYSKKTTVNSSAGWAVSNGTIYGAGEWHFIFHNRKYVSAGNTMIQATKTLTGGTLTAGEFTFALSAANDRTTAPLETAVNDADGNIRFAGLNYTEDDVGRDKPAEKHYYVYEVIPDGATPSTVNGQAVYTKDNIQYDPKIYPVTVTLIDVGNGNITATPDMDASQLTFNNTYAPGYIKVTKIAGVAGSIDANAKFYFRVYDETAKAYCSVTGKYINADGSDGTAFTVPLGVIPICVDQSVLINGYQTTDASGSAVIRPLELGHKYRITEVTDSGGNTEGAPSGYAVTYAVDKNAVNSAEVTIASAVTGNVTITNTPVGELTVKKVWLDENGSDASGSHTEPLVLELWQRIGDNGTWSRYSEDGETVYRITLDHANGWTATVKKLPVYASAGSKYEYCVKEPDSYSKTYSVVYSYNGREYKLSDEKTCSVTDDNGTSEKDPGYSMNVSGSTYGTVTITNRLIQTNILPTTGSSGTRPFMISGILLMASAAAGILLMLSRRRKKPPTG